MANHLTHETSPYLLQHADNPVDWYPWGEEALERAAREDRPLLVSIGYSACHWCHVMAHESFEDPETARLMNEHFVCVKVDREERPDVDAVCMEACQAMNGQGGWPLNCFLTPDQSPFFAGTYFPPEPRQGMPAWRQVLDAIIETWSTRRDDVVAQGDRVLASLGGITNLPATPGDITQATLEAAVVHLEGSFDGANGGWGAAPKFPQASLLEFLLARDRPQAALTGLYAMAAGGIHDQVGGGFHRYAVDATWTVPHFEKMLYDNALLARAYLHGWQVSGDERLRRVCVDTLDWTLAEMRGPEGGFYSALDADSEGVEGRYYVWTEQQLRDALGEELAAPAVAFFGVTETGNFEAANVLEGRGPEPAPDMLAAIRARLYEVREQRVRPGTDDKRLCSWNALMISALAQAGAVLERADYRDAAVACAEFVWRDLRDGDDEAGPHLLRTYKDGRAHVEGQLEDHGYLLEALLTLYEATLDERWFTRAVQLADGLGPRFGAGARGGFYTTSDAEDTGFARRRDLDDAPTPSGASAAAFGLLRLARLTGERAYEDQALEVLAVAAPIVGRHPVGFGHALQALDFQLAAVREVAVVGPEPGRSQLLRVVRDRYRPHLVLAGGPGTIVGDTGATRVPLLLDRPAVGGAPTAYVCEGFVCRAPVTDAGALAAALA